MTNPQICPSCGGLERDSVLFRHECDLVERSYEDYRSFINRYKKPLYSKLLENSDMAWFEVGNDRMIAKIRAGRYYTLRRAP